jgi:hypothetical protein
MEIWDRTILPAVISAFVGVITAYLTARVTARQEVRKKIAETLAPPRVNQLLNDLSSWVDRMRTGIPTPRDWEERKDGTAFVHMLDEYDSWLTVNLGSVRAYDIHLSEYACALRDQARDYIKPETRSADEMNATYRALIEQDLSALSRAVVQAHEKAMMV